MKVAFWNIGRTDEAYLNDGIQQYIKRLGNYLTFEYRELIIPKSKKTASADNHRIAERDEILKLLKANDCLVLLDDKGRKFSSEDFAIWLQKMFNEVAGNLIFLSGGPFGFHEDIYKRAQLKLSLSDMTFTHQMVRLIFLEQLYRGMTILRNEPYHH